MYFSDHQCEGNPECNNHGKCNINTGYCICDSGYTGKDCSQLSVMKSSLELSCNCQENEVCDTVNGLCICPAEYFGLNCDQSKYSEPKVLTKRK